MQYFSNSSHYNYDSHYYSTIINFQTDQTEVITDQLHSVNPSTLCYYAQVCTYVFNLQ